ncbi:hypothetical protein JDN40_01670 [Rhodomicrobium vannielii ATCC 17100]|uniref:hypothetical protein n=1 Tax=Rhodomicrobium vannielii TaxID=1069 RepID=UPI00191B549E|nr:hypothetical protein [Rhodomicrobium vannielii]MBJ7532825.1 hypothetical protein [Rhodomicrobium vannielii ATCC 17100]
MRIVPATILGCGVIIALGLNMPVFYKADPNLVLSAASVSELKAFQGAQLLENRVTISPKAGDTAFVTLQLTEAQFSAEGMRTKTEIGYNLHLTTKSRCYELEPGCLEIRDKSVLKAVSVGVTL